MPFPSVAQEVRHEDEDPEDGDGGADRDPRYCPWRETRRRPRRCCCRRRRRMPIVGPFEHRLQLLCRANSCAGDGEEDGSSIIRLIRRCRHERGGENMVVVMDCRSGFVRRGHGFRYFGGPVAHEYRSLAAVCVCVRVRVRVGRVPRHAGAHLLFSASIDGQVCMSSRRCIHVGSSAYSAAGIGIELKPPDS